MPSGMCTGLGVGPDDEQGKNHLRVRLSYAGGDVCCTKKGPKAAQLLIVVYAFLGLRFEKTIIRFGSSTASHFRWPVLGIAKL